MTLSKSELEAQYPEMPSIPSDIEISQNASMKQIPEKYYSSPPAR